jgi:hypothetical protein
MDDLEFFANFKMAENDALLSLLPSASAISIVP